MKFVISQKQIKEDLSEKERAYLEAWASEQDDLDWDDFPTNVVFRCGGIPELSVTGLILFLDDHLEGEYWSIQRSDSHSEWRVIAENTSFDEEGQEAVIDTLWEAVKIILRNIK